MQTAETTNGRLSIVMQDVKSLISWAEADMQHALENDAPGTARDDRRRLNNLKRVMALLQQCTR